METAIITGSMGVLTAFVTGFFYFKVKKIEVKQREAESLRKPLSGCIRIQEKFEKKLSDTGADMEKIKQKVYFHTELIKQLKKELGKFGSEINTNIDKTWKRVDEMSDKLFEFTGSQNEINKQTAALNEDMKKLFEKTNKIIGEREGEKKWEATTKK